MRVLFDLSRLKPNPNGTATNAAWSAYAVAVARPNWEVGLRCSTELHAVVRDILPADAKFVDNLENPDLVHVPQQISISELSYLRSQFASSISAAWLDFIAFRRPSYFASEGRWLQSQRNAGLALSELDGVIWLSSFVKAQAESFGWGMSIFSTVISPGVDHLGRESKFGATVMTERLKYLKPNNFCLLIAASLPHKNRVKAIRAFLSRPEFNGYQLVLGGSDEGGPLSTKTAERQLIADSVDEDKERIVDLGRIEEAELKWLYRNALFSIAVSDEEGFGIVPFESAYLGCACVTTPFATAIPNENPLVTTGTDESAIGAAFLSALDPNMRASSVEALLRAAAPYTWSKVGEDMAKAFEIIVGSTGQRSNKTGRRISLPRVVHKVAWELHPKLGMTIMNLTMNRRRR